MTLDSGESRSCLAHTVIEEGDPGRSKLRCLLRTRAKAGFSRAIPLIAAREVYVLGPGVSLSPSGILDEANDALIDQETWQASIPVKITGNRILL